MIARRPTPLIPENNASTLNTSSYVLKVGKEDEERLRILQQIYGSDTLKFLTEFLQAKENLSFLDMGCGTGSISIPIAEMINPSGKVVGIDISEEQITVAEKIAAENGLKNISFILANAEELTALHEKFDIVFCRFLMIHLQNPLEVLEKMAKCLKPGGILACEEPITSQLSCFPKLRAFDEANRLTCALGQTRGVNYDFGKELPHMFSRLPIIDIQIKFVQPLIGPFQRKIFAMSFQQIQSQILDKGLACQSELDEILQDLWMLANSEDTYVITGLRNTQIFGIKKL